MAFMRSPVRSRSGPPSFARPPAALRLGKPSDVCPAEWRPGPFIQLCGEYRASSCLWGSCAHTMADVNGPEMAQISNRANETAPEGPCPHGHFPKSTWLPTVLLAQGER